MHFLQTPVTPGLVLLEANSCVNLTKNICSNSVVPLNPHIWWDPIKLWNRKTVFKHSYIQRTDYVNSKVSSCGQPCIYLMLFYRLENSFASSFSHLLFIGLFTIHIWVQQLSSYSTVLWLSVYQFKGTDSVILSQVQCSCTLARCHLKLRLQSL